MDNAAQVEELSELENLEFNRRLDVAYAVIPAAVKLFGERGELDKRFKKASKAINSYWAWVVMVVALLIHYLILDGGNSFTWAGWIAMMVVAWWVLKRYEIWELGSQRDRHNERLMDLGVTWFGATGHEAFWEIDRFAGDGYFGNDNDEFRNWWADQTTCILDRVCGIEKGERIGKERARRSSEFRKNLKTFQKGQGGDDE